MIRTLPFLVALVLALPAAAQEVSIGREDVVTTIGASWRGAPGKFEFRWMPTRLQTGEVVICGAWALDNNAMSQGVNGLIGRARVRVGAETKRMNLRQLARAPRTNMLDGTEFTCIGTGLSGDAEGTMIAFGNGSFRG